MSEVAGDRMTDASYWQSPQTATTWYRRLVVGLLSYSFLAILLKVTSLLVMLNRPYGGFLWPWDNAHGVYRVGQFFLGETETLQPVDFILAVEGCPESPIEMRHCAHKLYEAAVSVCSDTPSEKPPVVHYTVLRRGETLAVTAPIRCFRLKTMLSLSAIPLLLGLLIWALGAAVYRAGPRQEPNLVCATCFAWVASFIATHGGSSPAIDTTVGQLNALALVNPSQVLMIPAIYHLTAILPRQHPSRRLYHTRWLWHLLIPILLLAIGTVRFQLGRAWHPLVGYLDKIGGGAETLYLCAAVLVLCVRYLRIYNTTQSRQAKHQVKLIGLGMLTATMAIPFLLAKYEPHLIRWIPINQPALFTWLLFPFIGFAFAILRYQAFPGRVRGLNILIALAVAIGTGLVFSFIPQLGVELGFVGLLFVLIGISIFWVLPNPLQHALRRLTSPGTIEREIIERFSVDIQGMHDMDTLPLTIVRSLERHLELSFAALWLEREPGVLALETYTDQAPATSLPDDVPVDVIWHERPTRLSSVTLAEAGCEILLPLKAGNERVGLVGLGTRWTEEVFDETDLVALGVMADQAALALQTAHQIRTLRLVPLQVEQAQLDERDRIAQDLHDATQAQLAQLAFALERVRSQLYTDPTQAEGLLDGCIQDVNQAARNLRAILRNLIPERLLGRTLSSALEEYTGSAQALYGKVTIDLQMDSGIEELLSPDGKLALLRICQQALDNALSHAQARMIRVTLQPGRDQDVVEFSIVDDGRGFIRRPTGDFIERGHHGLYIMESRALQHRGHLEIESTPGQGTVVKGYLPVEID